MPLYVSYTKWYTCINEHSTSGIVFGFADLLKNWEQDWLRVTELIWFIHSSSSSLNYKLLRQTWPWNFPFSIVYKTVLFQWSISELVQYASPKVRNICYTQCVRFALFIYGRIFDLFIFPLFKVQNLSPVGSFWKKPWVLVFQN